MNKRLVPPLLGLFSFTVPLLAEPPDFSVNSVTGFLSDVSLALSTHDLNKDGKLDANELKSRAWMLFMLDTSKDKMLSEEELRAGMGKLSQNIFPSQTVAPSEQMAPPFEPSPALRQAPRILKASEWAIDTLVPDLEVRTLSGEPKNLRSFAGTRGTVVAVLSANCPVSKRYAPVLARLAADYGARGFGFVLVMAPGEEPTDAFQKMGLSLVRDSSGRLLRHLKATHTTDVFLLDAAHTLVYRGAVDDQYGTHYSRAQPSHGYLTGALDALAAGKRASIEATSAPGCEIELPPDSAEAPRAEVAWHNRISRIVQAQCASCHHQGGIAPFPLDTYAQFLKKAGTVRRVLNEKTMPPWSAAPHSPAAFTPWLNERLLPEQDKKDLLAWIAGDRPEGDPKDAPLPRLWEDDWKIGKPDMIVQIPTPVEVQAEGIMPYQSIMVETQLTEDKWISGWEVRPSAADVVHHVLVYIYLPNEKVFPGVQEKRGHLAAYVPGGAPGIYREGLAKSLPAGARLRFEIHYTPNGTAKKDQTQLGLKFAATPPVYVVETVGVANVNLQIPPGASAHPQAADWKTPHPIHLLSLAPHMHVRGKSMRFEVVLPDKQVRNLLEVPRYDFNWQVAAAYAEPPEIPAGSRIKVTGWFDNSAANPANPDPGATVLWGSQTNDEMMIGYVEYYRLRETAAPPATANR